ncbi:MAG: hypothetical protein COX89_02155 [Candidatus Nealsonbacteria bacterium CG_4_10_14_0_2_um_filter_37_10]|uniref:Uncharacterized protein n=1 Tax=Candidatus Nealsonbacteria bacterium CG_4_10_14_0_2_um_filter_37_10 TaxID=1974679 RepID=A0A2M7UZD0_9BACT|nr:MAG: hypothetical protein COX89_02155 [Candidatus Nealsonbacteria bacterium CG_4_10_14_0_2_um_filter_37_10]
MSDVICYFFYINSCGMAGEGCGRFEECDLKILLEKCPIMEGKRGDHCDIIGWKALVPQGKN